MTTDISLVRLSTTEDDSAGMISAVILSLKIFHSMENGSPQLSMVQLSWPMAPTEDTGFVSEVLFRSGGSEAE